MSEAQHMTLEEAREFLKQAVASKGEEFIYSPNNAEDCWYLPRPDMYPPEDPRSTTGCLVGTALTLAGRTYEELNSFSGSVFMACPEFRLTHDAAQYFHRAQRCQDKGSTWGYALRVAEDWAKSRGII